MSGLTSAFQLCKNFHRRGAHNIGIVATSDELSVFVLRGVACVKSTRSEIPDMYPSDAAIAREMLERLTARQDRTLVEPWDGEDMDFNEPGVGFGGDNLCLQELTPPLPDEYGDYGGSDSSHSQ